MSDYNGLEYIEKQILKTHVRHGEKWFFVSTLVREMNDGSPGSSETMAWELDKDGARISDSAVAFYGPENSTMRHFLCVESLFRNGSTKERE